MVYWHPFKLWCQYIYIYTYRYMCVCVCVSVQGDSKLDTCLYKPFFSHNVQYCRLPKYLPFLPNDPQHRFKKHLKNAGFNTSCNFILNILTDKTTSSPSKQSRPNYIIHYYFEAFDNFDHSQVKVNLSLSTSWRHIGVVKV
jgi:hypothetical protein